MSEPLNPVSVEHAIRETANRIGNGVRVWANAYQTFREADTAFDLAFARAYMAHEGPQLEKKQAAVIATEVERSALDVADVAYRYADKQMRALEHELMAYQSVSKSVRGVYSAAGVGEGS